MGQLTGQYVSQSYQGLIKLENSNTGITTSLQFLEDGLGNNLPVQVSDTEISISGQLSVTGSLYQTGTFYADGLSFANSNLIQQDTGSYVMTYLNDGTVAYDTYPNIAIALAPYISGSTGSSGTSGTSGTSGANGSSGTSGTSGTSGANGSSGTSGTSGVAGSSGTSGANGSSGTSGTSGVAGSSGTSGTRGSSGTSGTSGTSGANGSSGTSGTSGANGSSGTSGTSGANGSSGTSGSNGSSGTSGTSGANGSSGTSGSNGSSGTSGTAGTSGSSGVSNSFFNYQAKTASTSGNPGSGYITWNQASQTGATFINVSDQETNNNNIDIFIGNIGSGSVITLQDKTNQSNYQVWRVGTSVDNTSYYTFPITLVSATHQFSGNDNILFIITTTPSGTSGSSGTSGAAGSSGTSGTSPANLDRNGLITTGSLSSNTQSITGSLIISGSELYDLTIQGRIAVSGSNGGGGANNPAISIFNSSTGDNTLMKGANTTIASPSNDSQTVYTAYQMESDIISTGDAIGIQVYGGTSPNWSKGASIYVNNDALDSYNAVFGFQDKANYTDGRITALFPLDVTGSVNISGSTNITGPLYVSSSASYDVVINNRLMVSGATTTPNPRIQVQGSDGLYSYMGRQAFHALTATGQATITSFAGGVVNFDNYDAGGTKDFGMVFEADTAGLTGWPSGPAIYSNDNLDNYPALIGFQDATNWTDGHVSILKDLNITGSLYVSSIPSGSSSNFVTWNNTTKEIEYTTSSGGSGSSGTSGTSGTSGAAGASGSSGTSGTSGSNGSSGTSGTSGNSGSSGTSGNSGSSGTSGTSGTSGANGSSGTSGTSGTSGDSIFAQTGSFWAASKDLQLTGSLLLSGSQLYDLTVQGRIAVSGSNGGGGANNPAISIINTSTGDNTLMKGSISSVSSPSNDAETYMTPYALESDIISTGDNIGIQAGANSPNWSNGASIYVNNDALDSYNAVFGFQDKAHYSDGRITALFPMDISGSLNVTGGVTGSFRGNGSGLTGITASAPVGVITTGSISTTQAITGSLIISGSAVITGSVQGNINALSISSSTASLNLNDSNFFTLQLVSGSNTYINPSNIKPGQTVNILLSTTGSATVTWPTTVKQPNSGSLYVPTTITSKDIVTLVSFDSTNLYLAAIKNFL